jgi:hypothetical protein
MTLKHPPLHLFKCTRVIVLIASICQPAGSSLLTSSSHMLHLTPVGHYW